MRTMLPCFILVLMCCSHCFSQAKEKQERTKFLKMNLVYRRYDSNQSFLGRFSPAFVMSSAKNLHELGVTELTWSNPQLFQEYKRTPVFRTGLIYLYKRNILKRNSRWTPQLGASFSIDYQSAHFIPKNPSIHKEDYQDIFTYKAYINTTISYMISQKSFLDVDVPVMVWNAEYQQYKTIRPGHQVSYAGSWGHSREYFNLRLGFRYMIS